MRIFVEVYGRQPTSHIYPTGTRTPDSISLKLRKMLNQKTVFHDHRCTNYHCAKKVKQLKIDRFEKKKATFILELRNVGSDMSTMKKPRSGLDKEISFVTSVVKNIRKK